jgi:hypothetical protein
MDNKLKDLLYRSFDSNLNLKEKKMLEDALAQSLDLRQEKEMIASLRENIKGHQNTSFSPFFADKVMATIQSVKTDDESEKFFDSLFILFRPIAIAATVLIIIFAGYNMSTTGHYSLEGALGIPDVTVDDIYDPTLALATEE